jgi:hypothetical protein
LTRALAGDFFFVELFFVEFFIDMVLTIGRLIVLDVPDLDEDFDALGRDEDFDALGRDDDFDALGRDDDFDALGRDEDFDVLGREEEVVVDLEVDLPSLGAGTLPQTTSWKPFSGVM